ncbi:hypothetical protein [Streptomyces sp. NBC_01235]|uniref:hypothetical protein n=1 Tax=Streptomyces sp. NBC_01235 TaxID=2903788 RepID=UPI002E12772F|nr:hypothetical protein OG289_34010 [Streptomyces sp. NBC_01235]
MAHLNDGCCGRPPKETQVTPRRGNRVLSAGVSVAGLLLGVAVLADVVEPDKGTALSTVACSTVTSVVVLNRRQTIEMAGPHQREVVGPEK